MSNVSVRRIVAPGLSVLGLVLAAGQARGQTDTHWLNTGGGAWSLAANWDNGVPSGNFNAFIDATGLMYVVTMDGSFSIVDFTLNVADATLDVGNNTLTLTGNYLQEAGVVRGAAAGTGTVLTGIGQTATLRDTMLMRLQTFASRGTLNIDGNTLLDVCDTGIDHSGSGCNWTGSGDIALEGTSFFTVGASGVFTIGNDRTMLSNNLPANAPALINNGIIDKNGTAGLTFVNNVALTNNGTVRASTGTLRFDTVTNFSGGTLTGGIWEVLPGATLDLQGQLITLNQADVTLSGPGSTLTQINGLVENGLGGAFRLAGGRGFTTSVPNFTTRGVLSVGAGSLFQVGAGNAFTGIGGTISGGGTVHVFGTSSIQGTTFNNVTFRTVQAATISGAANVDATDTTFDFQSPTVDWSGTGNINLNGTSGITLSAATTFNVLNSQTIASTNGPGTHPVITNNGSIVINSGVPGTSTLSNVRLNNLGTIPSPGVVDVRGGNTFVTPEVVNFAGGTLTGGRWKVTGGTSVLNFGTQNITTSRADIVLSGGIASAQFPNLQGFLSLNDTAGKLTLQSAESYTTAGNFTNLGLITVDGTLGASLFKVASGFTLTNYNPMNKKLTAGQIVVIGQGRESGTIEVDGLDIENLDADILLDGVGSTIIDPTSGTTQSALRNLNTIDNSGRFKITGGKSFLTAGSFAVNQDGRLDIGPTSEFEVPNTDSAFRLFNFNELTGEFNNGLFGVQGRLIAPNLRIRVLNNTVALDGNDPTVGLFTRVGMPPQDTLVNSLTTLERIGSGPGQAGHFTISGGYQLELDPGMDHNLSLLAGSSLTIGTPESPGGRLRIRQDVENPEFPGGSFFQNGELTITGGQLQVEGNWIQGGGAVSVIQSPLPMSAGGNLVQDGLMRINGAINVAGTMEVRGTLAGNATFQTGSGNFILENGVLMPGNSPGLMTIGGAGGLEIHGGVLEMEIMGQVGGVGYDQIHVLHQLMLIDPDPGNPLAKEVHVTLSNYIPQLGETFDLILYDEGRLGDFTGVTLPDVGFGRWFVRMDTTTSFTLVVVPAPASVMGLAGCGVLALRRRRRAV